MERLILKQAEDVDRAVSTVQSGTPIQVCVSDEDGPQGAEPQVEFLRMLLDQTQRWFAVTDLEWTPHPFVPKKYLRSCVIRPEPPGSARGSAGASPARSGRAQRIDRSRSTEVVEDVQGVLTMANARD